MLPVPIKARNVQDFVTIEQEKGLTKLSIPTSYGVCLREFDAPVAQPTIQLSKIFTSPDDDAVAQCYSPRLLADVAKAFSSFRAVELAHCTAKRYRPGYFKSYGDAVSALEAVLLPMRVSG